MHARNAVKHIVAYKYHGSAAQWKCNGCTYQRCAGLFFSLPWNHKASAMTSLSTSRQTSEYNHVCLRKNQHSTFGHTIFTSHSCDKRTCRNACHCHSKSTATAHTGKRTVRIGSSARIRIIGFKRKEVNAAYVVHSERHG